MPFTGDGTVPLPDKTWDGSPLFGELAGRRAARLCPNALKKVRGELKVLWTGGVGHSNIHDRGFHVSHRGDIVAAIQKPYAGARGLKNGLPKDKVKQKTEKDDPLADVSYVAVWDNDGNLLTQNAVGDTLNGHGVAIDRDRNIYATLGVTVLDGQEPWFGLPKGAVTKKFAGWGGWGGLFKYRGGIPFPRARVIGSHKDPEAASGSVKLRKPRGSIAPVQDSFQWAYPGMTAQSGGSCTCQNIRYDMDGFTRHWLPAPYMCSVMVLDANANVIARLGKYGNVDDTDRDVKEGLDGLRFVWPRTLCVSDTSLYVNDHNAKRILKAAIRYAKEETVALQ